MTAIESTSSRKDSALAVNLASKLPRAIAYEEE